MVSNIVYDNSNSDRGNLLLPLHGLLFLIRRKSYFICTIAQTYTMGFVTPVVKHWLEQEIAQWVHHISCRSITRGIWLFMYNVYVLLPRTEGEPNN